MIQEIKTPVATKLSTLNLMAWSVLFSFFYAIKISSYDIWWHLATGRWIAENHTIPMTDPFSFTAHGETWHYVTWLGDLLLYEVYQALGFPGLVLLKVLLAFLIILGLGLSLRLLQVRSNIIIITLAIIGFYLQNRYTALRPMVLGGVCLSWSIYLAVRTQVRSDRSYLWFILLTFIWIACHASAILIAGVWGILFLLNIKTKQRLGLFLSGLVILILFIATHTGQGVLYSVFHHAAAKQLVQSINEWRPTEWYLPRIWLTWGIILFFVYAQRKQWRSNTLVLLLGLFGFVLTARSWRTSYKGFLLATPLLALSLQYLFDSFPSRKAAFSKIALSFVTILLFIGLPFAYEPIPFISWFGFGVETNNIPSQTVKTLKDLPNGRVIHSFAIGGYLIWRKIPDGVFADGRAVVLYNDKHLKSWMRPSQASEEGLEKVADRFGIVYGLAPLGTRLGDLMLSSELWIPIHHGKTQSLFVRAKQMLRFPKLKKLGMPNFRFFKDLKKAKEWYTMILRSSTHRRQLKFSIHRNFKQSPRSPIYRPLFKFFADYHPDFLKEITQRTNH